MPIDNNSWYFICRYANVPMEIPTVIINWHIALLAHWQIISLDFRSVAATFSVLFFRVGEWVETVVTGFGDQLA